MLTSCRDKASTEIKNMAPTEMPVKPQNYKIFRHWSEMGKHVELYRFEFIEVEFWWQSEKVFFMFKNIKQTAFINVMKLASAASGHWLIF